MVRLFLLRGLRYTLWVLILGEKLTVCCSLELVLSIVGCFKGYNNGAWYWWAFDFENKKRMLLSFDMSDGLFKYTYPCQNLILYFREPYETLALILCPEKKAQAQLFDMGDAYESYVKGSWTKVLTLGPLLRVEKPLVFLKSDQLLMKDSRGSHVSHNLGTKQIKKHPGLRGRIHKRKKHFC
ncbi:hypothetical protein SLEP1_g2098 [Rubroshorea leprosula]|uniref:F-box associated domain-containing protein n=1 Tax=Rubroshorea leprosula TaxID=152421 RepID=A0AAV5HGH4_9ROSI|nr:hypothetical protein SLEP1_g2098 [Rubroshorea leprosula]